MSHRNKSSRPNANNGMPLQNIVHKISQLVNQLSGRDLQKQIEKRYKTPEARKKATEIINRVEGLKQKLQDHHFPKAIKNQEKSEHVRLPPGEDAQQKQRDAALRNHSRFQRRADRIVRVRDAMLDRIEIRPRQPFKREAAPPDKNKAAKGEGKGVEAGRAAEPHFPDLEATEAALAPEIWQETASAVTKEEQGQHDQPGRIWTAAEIEAIAAIESERAAEQEQDHSNDDPGRTL